MIIDSKPRLRLPWSFVRLVASQGVSMLGDSFRTLTLMLWVYDASGGSAVQLSWVVLAQLLPQIVLGPFAGAIVDRIDNIKAMIGSDLLRFVLGVVLLACAMAGNVPAALVTLALASAVGAVTDPAIQSAVHTLVDGDNLTRANGIFRVVEQSTFLVGPAAAAIAYSQWGATAALAADAASFLFAALMVWGLRAAPAQTASSQRVRLLGEVFEGLQHVVHRRALRIALLVYLCVGLIAGVYRTLMIPFVAQDLHLASEWVATVNVTNGIAQVAVGAALITLAHRAGHHGRMLVVTSAVIAAGAAVVAVSPGLPVLLLGIMVVAVGNMPFNVALAGLQQTVPDREFRGRVVSVFESLSNAAYLIAAMASGAAAQAFGPRPVLAVAAAVMVLATIIALPLRKARAKAPLQAV
ncbi:MAG TPA: MFS transporter [Candidatus Limnocylindrales bacterium]|nr:MFS transporter [Candidatus Limnocylindrales bacterium]